MTTIFIIRNRRREVNKSCNLYPCHEPFRFVATHKMHRRFFSDGMGHLMAGAVPFFFVHPNGRVFLSSITISQNSRHFAVQNGFPHLCLAGESFLQKTIGGKDENVLTPNLAEHQRFELWRRC